MSRREEVREEGVGKEREGGMKEEGRRRLRARRSSSQF